MTTEKTPLEDTPDFDPKKVEAELKEQEKQNLKEMDEKTNEDGQKKYAGGPIPS